MQRRPLEPIQFEEDDFLTPIDKLSAFFGLKSKENTETVCVQPLIYFDNYNRLFEMIGFQEIPVKPKGIKKLLYPETSPEGEHPTGFLQFGAEVRSNKHVIFEMGNHSTLVRFDFKENYPEGKDEPIYQLDELQIWDGDIQFKIHCDDRLHKPYLSLISKIISNSIQFLWNECYQDAKKSFETLDNVIRNLHDLSDQYQAMQNASTVEEKILERDQQNRNTP